MKITIHTAEEKFGKGQSNFSVESLLCHIAQQIGRGPITEMKTCTQVIKNNSGENIGWFRVEIGEPVPGMAKCDNCAAIWQDEELHEIDDLDQRVGAGEEMPVGQCPDENCGAVCHRFWEGER